MRARPEQPDRYRTVVQRLSGRVSGTSGMTLVEVLVATLVLSVGALSAFTVFDTSRRSTTVSEFVSVGAAAGEQELERIQALPYSAVSLASAPAQTSTTNPSDPTYYLRGCGSCYQWDWTGGAPSEPLVVSASGADTTPNPRTVVLPGPNGAARVTATIYRFVTWTKDPVCASSAACAGQTNYKRVTAAVTVNGGSSRPTVISTVVTNSTGGSQNPLTDPSTTCVNSAASVPCLN